MGRNRHTYFVIQTISLLPFFSFVKGVVNFGTYAANLVHDDVKSIGDESNNVLLCPKITG